MAEMVDEKLLAALSRFVCSICSNLVWQPVQTPCKHLFCRTCITGWLAKQEVCPQDRKPLTTRECLPLKDASPSTYDILGDQTIHCMKRADGCEWTGEYANAETHLATPNGCGYVVVPCKLACDAKDLLRKDLAAHEKSDCPNRKAVCSHCTKPIPWRDFKQHESVDCDGAPAVCPNAALPAADAKSVSAAAAVDSVLCTTKGLTRGSLAAHLRDDCPCSVVACPLANYGCAHKAARHTMSAHIQTAQFQHITVLINQLETQKTVSAELLKRVAELERIVYGGGAVRPPQMPIAAAVAGAVNLDNKKDEKDVKGGIPPSPKAAGALTSGFSLVRMFAATGGPNGLAITGTGAAKRLYVCEWFNARVSLYDLTTNKVDGCWFGNDKYTKPMLNPHSICIAPSKPDVVWVMDAKRGALCATVSGTGIDANGRAWKNWNVRNDLIPDKYRSATGVAIATDGTGYVCDGSYIYVYNSKLVRTQLVKGPARCHFIGVHLDEAKKELYASDGTFSNIVVYALPAFTVARVLGSGGNGDGSWHQPYGLCLDAATNVLYATDRLNHRVQAVNATTGKFICKWGSGLRGNGQTDLNGPNGIVQDGEHLYIADGFNGRIVVLKKPVFAA